MDCPISRIHHDILWQIFLENTETHNTNRLTTARYTSQVSRQWRTVMLESSSIWGRLIDLDDLCRPSGDVSRELQPLTNTNWAREVIFRTGKALLWIIGDMNYVDCTPSIRHFLWTFIEENWDRIQRLNISDDWSLLEPDDDNNEEFVNPGQYWSDLFKKPAPVLREFVFTYYSSTPDLYVDAREGWILPSPVFNRTAPALTKFEFYRKDRFHMSNFRFTVDVDMPVSWLSKLCSLTIHQPCSINQLLAVLEITPLLQDLTMEGYPSAFTELSGREIFRVDLPKLAFITLDKWRLPGQDILMFLERISPSRGCRFLISNPSYPNAFVNPQDIKRFQIPMMRYVQDFSEYHPSTRMALTCNSHFLGLAFSSVEEPRHSLSFTMWLPLGEDDSALIQTVFNEPFFSATVDLDLSNWMNGLPRPLSAFDSVTTLWIEYETLMSLLHYTDQRYGYNMFPLVNVLKVGHYSLYLGSEYREPLGLFLEHRRTIDRAIPVLDLSHSHRQLICDLDNLEDLTGLVVKWNFAWAEPAEEYVCGSGHPDILRFKTNYPENGIYANSHRSRGYSRTRAPYSLANEGWSGQIACV